jgi:hypothetical protein
MFIQAILIILSRGSRAGDFIPTTQNPSIISSGPLGAAGAVTVYFFLEGKETNKSFKDLLMA